MGAAALPARSRAARTSLTLRLAAWNERLPSEAGVHRHDEHEVHVAGDLLQRADRRRGIQHHSGPGAERLDGLNGAVQVRQHLDVHGDHRGAGLGKGLDVPIGVGNHQVHVERHARDPLQRAHDRNPDGDIGDEMAVHHVDMNQVGAAAFDGGNRVAKGGEVGREDRRRNLHGHRLTSTEIGSPGAI